MSQMERIYKLDRLFRRKKPTRKRKIAEETTLDLMDLPEGAF